MCTSAGAVSSLRWVQLPEVWQIAAATINAGVILVLPNSSGNLAIFAAIRRASFYERGYGTDRNHDHHEKNNLREDA
jgi:hypothetical protein